jgi:hypothetical protein
MTSIIPFDVIPLRDPQPYQCWNVLRHDLLADGYTPGYAGNPEAMTSGPRIDQEIAETSPCSQCGATRRFEAWANPGGGYGYAIAICTDPTCEHAELF